MTGSVGIKANLQTKGWRKGRLFFPGLCNYNENHLTFWQRKTDISVAKG